MKASVLALVTVSALVLAAAALPAASAEPKLPLCLTTSSSPGSCHDDGYNTCTKYLPDFNPLWICSETLA